ncbi:FAD-dependent oxidoreductase [Haloarculaceae archaeon H-GB2-1]|nr:FAD-dependent oxidoreductase [Haloarculaceae archaeon H-GB1-1]MEA5388191.1 FAD-dependent oxidoreductase [Haloarculaceae archaeon H-GB11]MEA5406210.1 FAD-dependent oxidoreductase [Haloarculaceae archaeon H-GB2-1]
MDVLIIGGGATGASAAWQLSERDDVDVTLCEQGGNVGHGSTPRAAGGIRSMYSTPVHVELSKLAIETWQTFEEDYGVEVDYKNTGYLFGVTNRTQYEQLRQDVWVQNNHGVPTELLDPEAASEHLDGLDTDRYMAVAWNPMDGFADPHAALMAYTRLARENGAQILTDHEVTDLRQDPTGRVRGVEVNGGEKELDADYVVNAAGPWGHRVAAMADVEIPITPKKRHGAMVEPERQVPTDAPLHIDLDSGVYYRPWDEEQALLGGHFQPDDPTVDPDDPNSYEDTTDMDWAAAAMEAAAETADYFGMDTRIVRGWSGVYAITPSNHPIIEESVPGFVNDVGHSGRAFMQSPATGRIVTEIVTEGEAKSVDTTALRTDDGKDTRGMLPIPYTADMYD